ncbi:hypothetical protein PLANTIT3_20105 [Plantibacter sp. T3]|nr:hypothetical protein PLANTIT3_20105 [Plantibacter sp. T3]
MRTTDGALHRGALRQAQGPAEVFSGTGGGVLRDRRRCAQGPAEVFCGTGGLPLAAGAG